MSGSFVDVGKLGDIGRMEGMPPHWEYYGSSTQFLYEPSQQPVLTTLIEKYPYILIQDFKVENHSSLSASLSDEI